MNTPEGNILVECRICRAKAVFETAYKRSAGDYLARQTVGLPYVMALYDADQIGQLCLRAMSVAEHDAVIAEHVL
jgi:hypothetical protein